MTAYTNFTGDFPARCVAVLDAASDIAKGQEREVTLLLMAASASFIVSFERLKPDTREGGHPFGDNKKFSVAAESLSQLMKSEFIGSELCPGMSHSWRSAKNIKSVRGGPEQWLQSAKLEPVTQQRPVASILKLLRNALAHGSLYTTGDPIKELIFVQRQNKADFEILIVGQENFEFFIRAWILFLKNANDS